MAGEEGGGGLFSADRARLRAFYRAAWQKHSRGVPLEPLEALVASVLAEHPEYHGLIAREDAEVRDFLPELGETNPYLHLGLHLALREQIATDRPPGVRRAYETLLARGLDGHASEHRMMECLAAALWQAQREGRAPEEAGYLACLSAVPVGLTPKR
jgi:hypothetical protein